MGRLSRSVPGSSASTEADLAHLFAVEHGPMLRLATLLVGSVVIAEDVVQDAFAAVGERWGVLERPGAYLRTSVVNGCRGVLRRPSTVRSLAHRALSVLREELT